MNIDSDAVVRLEELLLEENNPNLKLRIFVQGGGCSGLQYGFTFAEDKDEDDFEFTFGNVAVIVDVVSMDYLRDSTLRYRADALGASFSIDNPSAVTTCGCGSSFSPF